MYDGQGAMMKLPNDTLIASAYQAADYLDLPDLKGDILRHLESLIIKEALPKLNASILAGLLQRICTFSQLENWKELRSLVDTITKQYQIDPKAILDAKEHQGLELLFGLIIESNTAQAEVQKAMQDEKIKNLEWQLRAAERHSDPYFACADEDSDLSY
ncbi:hypothetical protein ABW20_dc0108400 [Dactylellina cionopaga]|nr:hypothetical protein ABW20_dc0108400 [Dactylellina cionopaga]